MTRWVKAQAKVCSLRWATSSGDCLDGPSPVIQGQESWMTEAWGCEAHWSPENQNSSRPRSQDFSGWPSQVIAFWAQHERGHKSHETKFLVDTVIIEESPRSEVQSWVVFSFKRSKGRKKLFFIFFNSWWRNDTLSSLEREPCSPQPPQHSWGSLRREGLLCLYWREVDNSSGKIMSLF